MVATADTLKVTLHGRALSVILDGQEHLKREIDSPPSGRCGLWSKADSQRVFRSLCQHRELGDCEGFSTINPNGSISNVVCQIPGQGRHAELVYGEE